MGSGRGRRAVVINLDDHERQTLERWERRRSTAQGLAMRCRIVLAAADGRTNGKSLRKSVAIRPRWASGGTVSPGGVSMGSPTSPDRDRPVP